MVLDETYNIALPSGFDKLVVVRKKLSCWFGDKDMNPTFDCVQTDGVMGACGIQSHGRYLSVALDENQLSGVKITTASPGDILSIACLSGTEI